MNYEERKERAREIIEYNIQIIYHIPRKYKHLERALMHEGIRKTLLKVFNFLKDKELFIYKRKYSFVLDNTRLTQLRNRTTASVSNRYINYLCCLGVINKQYQNKDEVQTISKINAGFLMDNPDKKRAINQFHFRKYTDTELARIEQRAKQLHDNGITPGNISFNKLSANDCKKLANEVYYANARQSIDKKEREYKELLRCAEQLCNNLGYFTKKMIYELSDSEQKEIDKLFKIYKKQIFNKYNYKAPTKQQIEQFKLKNKKWILTRKEEK